MSSSSAQAGVRHASPTGYVRAIEGIRRKTMLDGAHTQLVEFKLAQGAVIPAHSHPRSRPAICCRGT